jgi:hypothetical protein
MNGEALAATMTGVIHPGNGTAAEASRPADAGRAGKVVISYGEGAGGHE